MNFKLLTTLLILVFCFTNCDNEKTSIEGSPSDATNEVLLQDVNLKQKPNILWISCEDISSRIGAYGDSVAITPKIDQLAADGMKFTNVFTVAPVCAPNRSAIITGMYPTTIGTQHMRTGHRGSTGELPTPYASVLPPYVKAFTEYLRAAGYYCTNNSKTDYQFNTFGTPVTIWDENSTKAHYKNRSDQEQPFFSIFNYTLTHESKNWPDPVYWDISTVEVPPYYPDTEEVRKDIARSYENIARLDTIVGEHLKALEEEGLADNTIVFFWSDHGDGMPRGKRWTYDSGTKVPFIVRWPGKIPQGSVNDRLISSIDWGPTVLSLAGVPVPAHMQGRPFLGPQVAEEPEFLVNTRDRFDESYDMVRAVRDEEFRYVRNYYPNQPYVLWIPYRNRSNIMKELLRLQAEGGLNEVQKLWMSDTRPPEELYHSIEDPHEINNLVNEPEYQEKLAEMRQRLDHWRIESKDLGDLPESQMVCQMYQGNEQPKTSSVHFVPNSPENRASDFADEGGAFSGPMTVKFYCATQGASMAYTLEEGEDARWLLYTGPIHLNKGEEKIIRAKAVRYGYKESDETSATFRVN